MSKMSITIVILLAIQIFLPFGQTAHQTDPNGYFIFCPCMGRFGNQVDHYLGSMAFAKALDRTLVLPPWVEYRTGERTSIQVPFDAYFNVSEIAKYHRVVLAEEFMADVAPEIWPPELRTSFCYGHRPGPAAKSCNAKNGNPFGPFWDYLNVEFVRSETYSPLHHDVHKTQIAEDWKRKYPPGNWPVLAFTGAPATFPIQKENVPLQRYLVWNDEMMKKASTAIWRLMNGKPYIGLHLRNGIDWKRACEHVESSSNLFSSPQCLGYRNENGHLTLEMCQPSEEVVVKKLRTVLKEYETVKTVFIATDNDPMVDELRKYFGSDIDFVTADYDDIHLDLILLGQAEFFIGNCVSSFSAFVKRERDVHGKPSSFWGFPPRRAHDPAEL